MRLVSIVRGLFLDAKPQQRPEKRRSRVASIGTPAEPWELEGRRLMSGATANVATMSPSVVQDGHFIQRYVAITVSNTRGQTVDQVIGRTQSIDGGRVGSSPTETGFWTVLADTLDPKVYNHSDINQAQRENIAQGLGIKPEDFSVRLIKTDLGPEGGIPGRDLGWEAMDNGGVTVAVPPQIIKEPVVVDRPVEVIKIVYVDRNTCGCPCKPVTPSKPAKWAHFELHKISREHPFGTYVWGKGKHSNNIKVTSLPQDAPAWAVQAWLAKWAKTGGPKPGDPRYGLNLGNFGHQPPKVTPHPVPTHHGGHKVHALKHAA